MEPTAQRLRRGLSRLAGAAAIAVWIGAAGLPAAPATNPPVQLTDISNEPKAVLDLYGAEVTPTILHLMGIDHNRLTYNFLGLGQKLTGTEAPANRVHGILA
jgi:hypothetical protein